jgi:lipopolysaccharide/colanic/teichoic acid biosynthesis glycosyltransferase
MKGQSATRRWSKRIVDLAVAIPGLIVLSPFMAVIAALISLEDRGSPVYAAPRVGARGRTFKMLKFRTMRVNADRVGPSSTSSTDSRITRVGRLLRATKFDETLQLVNVVRGEMSLVGPRPQIQWAVDAYTEVEQVLLTVRPGITDLASIVFADEGEILQPFEDADLAYSQLIRPGKSRLGVFYAERGTATMDLRIIVATVMNSFDRHRALASVQRVLERAGADRDLVELAGRSAPLAPSPPPGAAEVVQSAGPEAR